MKKALVLSMGLVILGSANAQEEVKPVEVTQAPVVERNIYDLMYLPAQGTFFGSTAISSHHSTTNFQYLATDTEKVETSTVSLQQEFGYSLTSTTFLSLGIGYQLGSETTRKYGPGSILNGEETKTAKEKGMEDPSLFLRHRFSEAQTSSDRDIDFFASFSPKTGNAKSASTQVEGNAKRGSTRIQVGLDIGQKTLSNAWNARFSYVLRTKGTSESARNPNYKTVADPNGFLSGEFTYQIIFNPKFVLNLGAGLGMLGIRESENKVGEFKNKYDSAGFISLLAGVMYNPTPNISLFFNMKGFGVVEHDLVQTDTSDGSKTTYKVEQDSNGEVVLGTAYQF